MKKKALNEMSIYDGGKASYNFFYDLVVLSCVFSFVRLLFLCDVTPFWLTNLSLCKKVFSYLFFFF